MKRKILKKNGVTYFRDREPRVIDKDILKILPVSFLKKYNISNLFLFLDCSSETVFFRSKSKSCKFCSDDASS